MYGTSFYDVIREGIQRSADAVVPVVLEHLPPIASVIDVGCGEGWWGREFENHGCRAIGVDGDYVQDPVIEFRPVDLERTLPDLGWYDLAVCLEVAEHLERDRSDDFIRELCALAPIVLFSAAIPGQGGTGHKNEQWPAYWVDRFRANGYECSGALRWVLWSDGRVENWYRQNLIVATASPGSMPTLFDTPTAEVLPIVHPVLYDARR